MGKHHLYLALRYIAHAAVKILNIWQISGLVSEHSNWSKLYSKNLASSSLHLQKPPP